MIANEGYVHIIDNNLYVMDSANIYEARLVFRADGSGLWLSEDGINGEFVRVSSKELDGDKV